MTLSRIPSAQGAKPRLPCAAVRQAVVRLLGTFQVGAATRSRRERFQRVRTPHLAAGGLANASWRAPTRLRKPLQVSLPFQLRPCGRRTIKRLLLAAVVTASLVSGTITAKAGYSVGADHSIP